MTTTTPNFVVQDVRYGKDREQPHKTVRVYAQPTECPYLVISPGVGVAEDGSPVLRPHLALIHTLTGLAVVGGYGESSDRLWDLASKLRGFDWNRADLAEHITANPDWSKPIAEIIRGWRLADAYQGPVHYSGEPDDLKAARAADPAGTLLRESLDEWVGWSKHLHESKFFDTNRDAWYAGLVAEVQGYGMAYLLAVLRAIDPKVADGAARDLVIAFDAGDSMGEWIYQWREELAEGKPLTLRGIPTLTAGEPRLL